MKASQKNFAAQMTRAAAEASVFYFCGPDEAGASDAAARLSAHIAAQQGAFERVELAGADLRRDPVRLADEARSVSLFGDTRQIHIRCAGDEAFDAVETLLASPVAGWPVFILATSASDKSRIAKLLSDRPDALVTMFHPPDTGTVTTAVREMADRGHLYLSNDLLNRSTEEWVRHGMKHLGLMHDAEVVRTDGVSVWTEDMTLLYYYRNRLAGYGLSRLADSFEKDSARMQAGRERARDFDAQGFLA